MPTTKRLGPVHTALMRKVPALRPIEVSGLATLIGKLNAGGMKVDDVFTEGIVAPDAVTIAGNLTHVEAPNLGDLLLAVGKGIKDIKIFPQGIPAQPDFFRVNIRLGRQ